MVVAEIELYKILKTKFTEEESEAIVASFEQKGNNSFELRKNEFATKEDIANLRLATKEDIAKLSSSTKEDIAKLELNMANLRTELLTKIAESNQKLEVKIAETKAEIIRWNFIFWIGQLATFIAIAKFFFHQ